MPGITGIQGIQGLQGWTLENPDATPFQIHGHPANPVHGQWGEQAEPYPWEAYAGSLGIANTPLGAENELLSDLPESETFLAGNVAQDDFADQTPYFTHAGPTPKGFYNTTDPEQAAAQRVASSQAHAVDTGAQLKARESSNPLQDNWTGFFNPIPGEELYAPMPTRVSQQSAGFGANDHLSNASAKRNMYDYDTAHRHRRYAVNSVPGNYMWMRPGSRPMMKTVAGPARPAIGTGPFTGQDTTTSYGIDGAILQDNATEYVSPPQPYVTPAVQAQQSEAAPEVALW